MMTMMRIMMKTTMTILMMTIMMMITMRIMMKMMMTIMVKNMTEVLVIGHHHCHDEGDHHSWQYLQSFKEVRPEQRPAQVIYLVLGQYYSGHLLVHQSTSSDIERKNVLGCRSPTIERFSCTIKIILPLCSVCIQCIPTEGSVSSLPHPKLRRIRKYNLKVLTMLKWIIPVDGN